MSTNPSGTADSAVDEARAAPAEDVPAGDGPAGEASGEVPAGEATADEAAGEAPAGHAPGEAAGGDAGDEATADEAGGEPPEESPDRALQARVEALEAENADLRGRLEALQAAYDAACRERDDFRDRLAAVSRAYRQKELDVKRTRERLERDLQRQLDRRRGEVLKKLFEPLQNLRRALDHMGDDPHAEGLRMVLQQFRRGFEELGLEEVPGKGARFDPGVHEAIQLREVGDPALDGVVLGVFEAGYRVGDTLLHAAKVIVGRYVPPPEPEDGAEVEEEAGSEEAPPARGEE